MVGRRTSTGRWAAGWCCWLLLALVVFPLMAPPAAAAQTLSPEVELAQRYAPIALLKEQDAACDENGEPFRPAPVNVTFNDPAVFLREDPPLTPEAEVNNPHLYDRAADFYVDLPGNPRDPGCTYETDFKARMGDQPSVVYAHIATENGKPGLALQYWFFYWFNDFNNVHEGDWEMIQVLFDVDTVAEALQTEPVSVAFAQHDSGEVANWNDPKLDKIDGHPVVYVSRGSHAAYFGPATWLGWGQDNSGLGCDYTTGPSVRVDPEIRLIPDTAVSGPDDAYAWTTFTGRWGQRDQWFFNGPTGPNEKPRWTAPITWQAGLRQNSAPFYGGPVLGPAATDIFCDTIATLSKALILSKPYPIPVALAVLATLAVVVVMARAAWPVVRVSVPLYWRHGAVLIGLGLWLAPFTLIAVGIMLWLNREPDVAAGRGFIETNSLWTTALSGVLFVQQAVLLLIVGPAVIWATREILAGRSPRARRALAVGWNAAPRVLLSEGMVLVAVSLLALTVIGLPFAAERGVRWAFATHAVVLDGENGRGALARSSAAVRGRWWRTALTLPVLAFTGAFLGPLVGILLIMVARMPADLANSIGGIVYAITQPLAIAGGTVLYLRAFAPPPATLVDPVEAPVRPVAPAATPAA